jgi:predicted esterase
MKNASLLAIALSLCAAPLLAQEPAPKTDPPKAEPPKTAPKQAAPRQDTARAFTEEFRRGYDLLVAGKWAEGMASMHKCLEIQPEAPLCAYNLACAHARQGQIDDGVAWFQKSADWGFGYDPFADAISAAEKDTDLDPLRKDPRFVAAMEQVRARTKAAEEYVATPATYVPKSLEGASEIPLLVVLHPSGATKESVVEGRWKTVADELGLALLAPSARVMTARDPKAGMAWYLNLADYAGGLRLTAYEKSVTAALDAFKKTHKIDPARVFIAGDLEGGLVATRLAFAYPQTYKGAVAVESPFVPTLLQSKAGPAAKAGLKYKLLLEKDALAKRLAADPSQPLTADNVIAQWSDEMTKLGFQGAVEAWSKDPSAPGADATTQKIVATLRAMQPATVEAGAPK